MGAAVGAVPSAVAPSPGRQGSESLGTGTPQGSCTNILQIPCIRNNSPALWPGTNLGVPMASGVHTHPQPILTQHLSSPPPHHPPQHHPHKAESRQNPCATHTTLHTMHHDSPMMAACTLGSCKRHKMGSIGHSRFTKLKLIMLIAPPTSDSVVR